MGNLSQVKAEGSSIGLALLTMFLGVFDDLGDMLIAVVYHTIFFSKNQGCVPRIEKQDSPLKQEELTAFHI